MALAFLLLLEADAFLGRDGKRAGLFQDTAFATGNAVGLQEQTTVAYDLVMLATERTHWPVPYNKSWKMHKERADCG
jgi:hypothetical protein